MRGEKSSPQAMETVPTLTDGLNDPICQLRVDRGWASLIQYAHAHRDRLRDGPLDAGATFEPNQFEKVPTPAEKLSNAERFTGR